MRPEKVINLINRAIEHKLRTGSNEKFSKDLIAEMENFWNEWSIEEDDYRSGEETYGYSDAESIKNNLEYISDRWRCAFRIRWIIDGLMNGSI